MDLNDFPSAVDVQYINNFSKLCIGATSILSIAPSLLHFQTIEPLKSVLENPNDSNAVACLEGTFAKGYTLPKSFKNAFLMVARMTLNLSDYGLQTGTIKRIVAGYDPMNTDLVKPFLKNTADSMVKQLLDDCKTNSTPYQPINNPTALHQVVVDTTVVESLMVNTVALQKITTEGHVRNNFSHDDFVKVLVEPDNKNTII